MAENISDDAMDNEATPPQTEEDFEQQEGSDSEAKIRVGGGGDFSEQDSGQPQLSGSKRQRSSEGQADSVEDMDYEEL